MERRRAGVRAAAAPGDAGPAGNDGKSPGFLAGLYK